MKPRNNPFVALSAISGLAAVAVTSSAFADQIDVVATLAPENTTVSSGVRGARALTTSQTWTANNEYFLTDRVFIPNGITLTIEPGTKIYGSTNDNGTPANRADDKVGALIATRGGRLVADGTPSAPIVFASVRDWEVIIGMDTVFDQDAVAGPAPTKADAGLWGGVVLLGNAYLCHLNGVTGNNLGNALIEGFVPGGSPNDDGDALADSSEYGFDAGYPRDDEDDSGVIRYVSIRNGGYEFDAGREINGLTLGAVGAGTVIDHVEVFANQDDGIEFFGGTVSTSHIVLAYNQDDSFDFDSGHTGKHQFWFSIQDPGFTDGGWEADGIEGTTTTQGAYDAAFASPGTLTPTASRATKQPVSTVANYLALSKPVVYNATMVGPGRSNTFSTITIGSGQVLTEKGNHAFIFDDFFNGEIYNSVFDDFSQDIAFFRDGDKSYGATPRAAHNTMGRFGSAPVQQVETATAAGTITTAGDVLVTVTGTGITGSPLAVNVPVLVGDTATVWARKVRTALAALPAVTGSYLVPNTGNATIILAAVTGGSNDSSLNVALDNGTAAGVTAAASSSNTQGGAASSVTTGGGLANTSYISGINTLNLFINTSTGAPTDNNSQPNTDPQFTTYTRNGSNVLTAINPIPGAASPLLKSNGATLFGGAPMPVTYRGAFGTSNWAAGWTKFASTGILQGAGDVGAPPFADVDGDGISDTLEATSALTALGFSAGVNNVSPTNLFNAIYTGTSILDVRSVGQVTVQAGPVNVNLTLPVEKSDTLGGWTPAGNMTLSFPKTSGKEFYRITIPD